jgi:haloalkane dehalogenase
MIAPHRVLITAIVILILFTATVNCDNETDVVTADDIPIAHTPGCGWVEFPPPILANCTEPLVPEAPDLRGLWEAYTGLVGHVERIEQCGNRVIITAGGVIHDMRADGTLENGVNDVSAATCDPIQVAAEFTTGRLELRPFGGPVLVSRWREGDELVWEYGSVTSRLRRINELPDIVGKCDSEPEIMTTTDGIQFVRTPNACFKDIPDFPYEARDVEIDGLRQGYVDEGPAGADPVLLLHGQPSWSYLYRKMIPVLVDSDHRVIAMDHIGMGRSDKPIDIEYYSYLGHIDRLEKFIQTLNLEHITLFCQDWGSLIGLRVAGEHPEWFARIVVGDGTLPVVPAGIQPYPSVENPQELNTDIVAPFASIPPQQPPFFDEKGNRLIPGDPAEMFADWIVYSMTAASFHPAEVVEALTYFDLSPEAEAAYDAPFPSRVYMAGPRVFPSLVNELPGETEEAWDGLTEYNKPFLTIWASNDPGNLGQQAMQDRLVNNIPGAAGQPHIRLPEASHFLQDDQGAEIARLMVEFIAANPR